MSCKDCTKDNPYCRCKNDKKLDKIIDAFDELDEILKNAKPSNAFANVRKKREEENEIHWNEHESIT